MSLLLAKLAALGSLWGSAICRETGRHGKQAGVDDIVSSIWAEA